MQISYEETGILTVPYPVLQDIWSKAALLTVSDAPVPPSHRNTVKMVSSASNPLKPHCIGIERRGLAVNINCDQACHRFRVYKICQHSVACANYMLCLVNLVNTYKTSAAGSARGDAAKLVEACQLNNSSGRKATKRTSVRMGRPAAQRKGSSSTVTLPPVCTSTHLHNSHIIVREIAKHANVRVCYVCRQSLGKNGNNGGLPLPPDDFVLALKVTTKFVHPHTGNLTLSRTPQFVHAHLKCRHKKEFAGKPIHICPGVELTDHHQRLL